MTLTLFDPDIDRVRPCFSTPSDAGFDEVHVVTVKQVWLELHSVPWSLCWRDGSAIDVR